MVEGSVSSKVLNWIVLGEVPGAVKVLVVDQMLVMLSNHPEMNQALVRKK